MIRGVHQVLIEVDDQDRALTFWTEVLDFDLVQDAPYGEERWLEVRTPGGAVTVVLGQRSGERPKVAQELPTSNVWFYCEDLDRTYNELSARGVNFPRPPVEQPFGWWSMFEDTEGNRFALTPHEGS
jgi:predicted enzyme related to lactoylglutathione lyase